MVSEEKSFESVDGRQTDDGGLPYYKLPRSLRLRGAKNLSMKYFIQSKFDTDEGGIISIFHGCMVWIEKSVTWVTVRLHEACLVMPNSDPEWRFFLSTPYTHDRYFFLHTFLIYYI